MSISCTALRSAILTSFFFPLGNCLENRTKFCTDRKTLPSCHACKLQNASQHVPVVYLQQFPSYSNHNCKQAPFLRTLAFIFCLPWGRPCGNHAKRCMNEKTIQCLPNRSQHVPIYLQQFPSYLNCKCKKIAVFTYRSPHFCFPWRRPCDYHAIYCMDGKTIQCLPNPSQHVPIYLQFRVIRCLSQCVSPKIAIFTTFLFPLETPL